MGEFLVILICLCLNAVLAAVEMSFVTVTKSRLREAARQGQRDAARILALRDNPERTLSIIQVGITIVGSAAAAVGGIGAVSSVSPWMQSAWHLNARWAGVLSLIAVVVPITYVNVVLGELVPKTIALKNPLAIVLRSARWLLFFGRIFSPVVTLLEGSTRVVLGARDVLLRTLQSNKSDLQPRARDAASPNEQVVSSEASADEMSDDGEAVELDQLSYKTREYVLNLVDLERKRIRDVRLPWNQVVAIATEDPATLVEQTVLASGHTRLPVLDGKDVVGIINTKEFIALRFTSADSDWRTLVRPVIKVDEGAPILRALRRMQDNRSHLSITYRAGRLSGIVTIEDILEEIIGDLFDEDDDGKLRRVLATSARWRSYAATGVGGGRVPGLGL